MFCKKCGAPIDGEGTICPNCLATSGTGDTPAKLDFAGVQTFRQKNTGVKNKMPLKRILIPLTAVVLAVVLVFGGITVYGIVFSNPAATLYKAIEKTLQSSSASFSFDADYGSGYEEVEGKGFFSLGKDIGDSVAYIEATSSEGDDLIAGIADSRAASNDSGYYDYGDVDDFIAEVQEDFEDELGVSVSFSDVVKNKQLNFKKLEELYNAYRDYIKREEDVELPPYKEVLGVLQDFFMKECKKKKVREMFIDDFEKDSASGGTTYSFSLDIQGFGDAFGEYLASLHKYDDLYKVFVDEIDDENINSIEDIVAIGLLQFTGRNYDNIDMAITVSKGYVTEIGVRIKADGEKMSANLEIEEINKLDPDKKKVNRFIENAWSDYNGYGY